MLSHFLPVRSMLPVSAKYTPAISSPRFTRYAKSASSSGVEISYGTDFVPLPEKPAAR